MSKIESGRWSEQLRRMFGMAGTTLVSGELSPEVSPIVILESESVQWNFLKGVRDVYVGHTVAAAVGFTSKMRLRNPANSGVAGVLEFTEMTPNGLAVTMTVAANEQTVDFPTAVAPSVPDNRWGPLTTGRSTLVVTSTNAQATGPAGEVIGRGLTLSGVPWLYQKAIFVAPGVAIDLGIFATNLEMLFSFKWSERSFPVLEQ